MPAGPAISAGLKALMASKYFWPALIGGTFLGQTALEQLGQRGERSLAREQIRMQGRAGEASAEATKRATEEAQARAKEYTKLLLEAQRTERKQSREQDLMEAFLSSQDRRMALLMQAIQGISQAQPQYRSGASTSGMVGLMRA